MHFSWLALIFSDHIAFLYFWCNFPMKSYTSHWRYIRWSNKIGKHWQWRHRRQKLMESWCDYPHREENMSPNSWKLACFTNQKHFAHFSKQSNVMELWLEFSITKIKLKIYASVPDIRRVIFKGSMEISGLYHFSHSPGTMKWMPLIFQVNNFEMANLKTNWRGTKHCSWNLW